MFSLADQHDRAVPPLATYSLTADLITASVCDDATKETLTYYELCKLSICFSFVTFLLLCFLASNPVDFCHLNIFDGKIMCSSTDCQGYFSITKQQKQKTKTKDMCPYSCPSLCAVFFLCTFHQKSFRLPPPASNKFLSTGSLPLE